MATVVARSGDRPIVRPEPRHGTAVAAHPQQVQGEQPVLVEPAADGLPAGPGRDRAEGLGLVLVGAVGVDALARREADRPAAEAAGGRPPGHQVGLDAGRVVEHAGLVPEVGGVQLAAELASDADEEVAVERRHQALAVGVGAQQRGRVAVRVGADQEQAGAERLARSGRGTRWRRPGRNCRWWSPGRSRARRCRRPGGGQRQRLGVVRADGDHLQAGIVAGDAGRGGREVLVRRCRSAT